MDFDYIWGLLKIPLEQPIVFPVFALVLLSLAFGLAEGTPWKFVIVIVALGIFAAIESSKTRTGGRGNFDGEYFQLLFWAACIYCAAAFIFGRMAQWVFRRSDGMR